MHSIELAQHLIKSPSTHGRPHAMDDVVALVEAYMTRPDLTIRKYEFSDYPSIVISNTEDYELDIILSGHLDVVDAQPEQFTPTITDGWLYGRGAMDMKTPVAVMMNTFLAQYKTGLKMALLLTTDEEIGGFRGTKELLDTIGYRSTVAFVPDGGYRHDQIALKEKGVIRLHIAVEGVSAHSSRPWQGDNAIFRLMELTRDIETYHQRLKADATDDEWYTTINLSQVAGGEAMNTVPENAVADYDIRYTEDQSPEEIIDRIEDIAAKYDATVDVLTVGPNVFVDQENPYVQQYVSAMKACGIDVRYTRDFGASDARFFAGYDIPVVISQPFGLDWHNSAERVQVESVEAFEQILTSFITNFST